ncbi:MAG: ribulokinase, partial [Candidatus Brocadiae bacterium]|nr:ribulokinase [Candidatus Brocadiia bacterium]
LAGDGKHDAAVVEEAAGRIIPELTAAAEKLTIDESGIVALDWMNGRRTPDANQLLKGAISGLNLGSSAPAIFRALVEATAFGSKKIVERFESEGVPIKEVIALGGVAKKSPFVMQVLADVLNRNISVASSEQTCALGAAMAGAVVAGSQAGGYDNFEQASEAMTAVREDTYVPSPEHHKVYGRLFKLYRRLHDIYGTRDCNDNLYDLMKEVLAIRDEVRG